MIRPATAEAATVAGLPRKSFACFDPKVVIELDGGQHAGQSAYDEQRTRWLASEGFSVLRFWNIEVLENLDGVMEKIAAALGGASESRPPP